MTLTGRILRVSDFQMQRLRRLYRRKPDFNRLDDSVRRAVETSETPVGAFDSIVDYFWQAFKHYVDEPGTVAYYPGWPSCYGADSDGLEGVSRTLPLWAAYSDSPLNRDRSIGDEMHAMIRKALLNGTNPTHRGFWGRIGHRSTLICEAADIALAIWLSRKTVWAGFSADQKQQVLGWLRQVIGKETVDNNWHLFVVLTDAIVKDLDPGHSFTSADRYQRVADMYVGDGCFKDGPHGKIDFYNAWAFHYVLFWLDIIYPELVKNFARDTRSEYVAWYRYLFAENGFPLYGRSLCYRMAAPVPLLAAAFDRKENEEAALTVLLACWRYFVSRGALANGRPTQGVFEDNILWLDPYSGPASAFWSVRSLILFYFTASSIDWSNTESGALPLGQEEISIYLSGPGFRLTSNPSLNITGLQVCESDDTGSATLLKRTLKDRIKQLVFARGVRPANNLLERGRCRYDSTLELYRA